MKGTILVVDDEPDIRNLFTDTFVGEGYDVCTAENGEEAIEMLQKTGFDVVFLDLKLFGMNGIEACRKIRKKYPLAIIYAMTGWGALFEIEECREAGFDDFFTKPLRRKVLSKALDDAFEKIARWQGRHGNLYC